ncbi:hypothetical protein [Occallatibacter riparius]|uniref:DUF3108 domain-containing protein n=1 Tax=Occallatibacter riparius TaxID=1002689 RepID=A0A9J7BVU7_9BACT|nr:hypothetical protein [Occallatibacter riparius]UWZ86649.1 hypothetical protein MOP44_12050 [Occallatibacter riparius]
MMRSRAMYALLFASTVVVAQTAAPAGGSLKRHYQEGQTLTYRMTAVNDGWRYTAEASGVTKKTPAGAFVEEFRWTGMTSDGKQLALSPAMAAFRQTVSLDPSWMPGGPSLANADSKMVGPITDLFTFYVDLWLINKIGFLHRAGDHFHVPNPQPASWADGTRVILGKDHIDFDLNIQSVHEASHTAVVLVRHVPPAHPNLEFPAEWMKAPVVDTPNNWVEVTRTDDGKYEAAAGKETFDVTLTVSTEDGRILSGVMENPVITSGRLCDDAALTKCGPAQPQIIRRHIEIVLER